MATALSDDFERTFNRALLKLVIPIALQNLISAAVISADIVMLGIISQSAMAAVSLAGQVTFVLTLFYLGLATGAGILTAQYWGRKDVKAIQSILNIACLFAVGISLVFFAVSLCFPIWLMHIFTTDPTLISYGAEFLRVLSFSYIAMGFSQIYLSVLKSMETARLCAAISSMCLILNIALNALCIFVLFPGEPEAAITGVAFATVCARFIELGCCIVHSIAGGYIRFHLPGFAVIERNLIKDYLKYTIPIQANYVVWGGALTATVTIIGHVDVNLVAANSVAAVVKNLAIVLCAGISSGGAVLVGKYLGNGAPQLAKRVGDRINLYALLFGVLAGITILLLKPLIFFLVALSPTAREYLDGMLYICAYYCIGKASNSTNIGGIFCAGGDTKFGFLCDTLVMWGIVLPVSFMCAFVWHLHPIIVYAVISLDEIIKLPIAVVRYRQYKWLNNLTRNFAEPN